MVFFIEAIPLLFYAFIVGGERCYSNTSIPTAVYGHQAAYYSTSHVLYLFGGTSQNSIYKWDINPNTWTTLTTTTPTDPFESWINNAVTIHDIAYFIGVDDGDYDSGKVYRFHFPTEQWLSPGDINMATHPSIRGCLTHNTTHIFMVGGQTSSNTCIDQLQTYKISSNAWSTETINVSPIQGQCWLEGYCHSIGIDLYIFGGSTTEDEADVIDGIFKYNPNDKWTSIGRLPQVQGWGSAVYDERSRAIYLVGGWGEATDAHVMDTIYVFDTDTETITDTWNMIHSIASAPVVIIDHSLYVFGGEEEYTVATSSIQVCGIPHAITKEPTTNPTASPTRNPSASPTNNPSQFPTDDPSTAPVHNPSVSPTKPPSNQPTSAPISQPSSPTLRADIPTEKSIPTVGVTQEYESTERKYHTESAEDNAGESNQLMTVMWIIGSLAVIVCIVVVLILCIYRMVRQQHEEEVERMQSSSHNVDDVPSPPPNGVNSNPRALCDDANRNHVANGCGEGDEDINVDEFVTASGPSNIAPDEFVVVGDDEDQDGDEDTNQWKANTIDLNEVVTSGQYNADIDT